MPRMLQKTKKERCNKMREIELIYVEVMNETEHIFIFTTKFNGQDYAQMLTLNIALPIVVQDSKFNEALD